MIYKSIIKCYFFGNETGYESLCQTIKDGSIPVNRRYYCWHDRFSKGNACKVMFIIFENKVFSEELLS